MDIRTINIAREKEWRYNRVEFVFRKKITVSREVLSRTLLSLVAEVGYFIGTLDLGTCIRYVLNRLE